MSDEKPEGYDKALAFVIDTQKCTASGVQRHLKCGYNAAVEIIAQLEAEGVVTSAGEKAKREVLIAEIAELPTEVAGETLPEVTEDNVDDIKTSEGWDVDGQHQKTLEALHDDSDLGDISTDQMVFDMRDAMLKRIKGMTSPWSGCSQAQQREIGAALEEAAKDMVQHAVEAIVARGVDPVRILLTKVALGNEIVITGKVRADDPEDEFLAVKNLHHALNKFVMLTVATSDEFNEGGREFETMPDEPGLEFEDGADMAGEEDPFGENQGSEVGADGDADGELDDDDDADETEEQVED